MKKFIGVLLVMLISTYAIEADTFNFDLKSFSPPDYSRTSLEVGAGLQSLFGYQELFYNDGLDHDEYKRLIGYIPTMGGALTLYSYSKERIQSLSIVTENTFGSVTQRTDEYLSEDTNIYLTDSSIEYSLQQYLTSSLYIKFSTAATAEVEDYNFSDDYDYIYGIYNGSLELGFGLGRIENVSEARTAIFMYEDMKKYGTLTGDPTPDDIRELASLIVERRNKRAFDARDNYVETVKSLDTFFKTKTNLTYDASYYAAMTDVYLNAPVWTRYNGSELYLGIRVRNEIIDRNYDDPYADSLEQYTNGLSGYISYSYENPLSQKWQLSGQLYSSLGYMAGESNSFGMPNRIAICDFESSGRFQASYYPTQRTHAWARFLTSYAFQKAEDNDDWENSVKLWTLALSSGMTYYVSSQLSYTAELQFGHLTRKIPNEDPTMISEQFLVKLSAAYKIF